MSRLTFCWCDQVMWPRPKSIGQGNMLLQLQRERWFWTTVQFSRMLMRHFSLHMSNTELLMFPSKPSPPALLPVSITGKSNCLDQNPWNHPGLFFFIFSIQCFRKSCQLSHQTKFSIQSLHMTQCYCLVQVIVSCSAHCNSLLVTVHCFCLDCSVFSAQ